MTLTLAIRALAAAAAAFALALPAAAAPAPMPAAPPAAAPLVRADLEPWLDGYLPFALRRADVAGAVVVVVKDGRVVLQKGYGLADVAAGRGVDPETTLFRVGSVSKTFTWTAVMQLVEQGRIDLDRDIGAYLDFALSPFDGRPVTMRMLMSHTAGFQNRLEDMIVAGRTAPALGAFLKDHVPARIFAAGAVPAYSNYGAGLAGYIVERVSGQPFADYVATHIFAPLGMEHATFRQPLPAQLAPALSKGYLDASGDAYPFEIFSPAPAGGATVSGADMGRFMTAHLAGGVLDGRRILAPDTLRTWHASGHTVVDPALNRIALGLFETRRNGRRILGHEGDTRLFHSAMTLLVDEHVGLFVAMNSAGLEQPATRVIRQALFEGFVDRYFPAPAAAPATMVPAAQARAHADMMTGTYEGSRRAECGFFSLTSLLTQVALRTDGEGRLVTPFIGLNGQPQVYEEIEPFVWRVRGGQDLLAARVVDGDAALWAESGDASVAYLPVPVWRRAGIVVPALALSLTTLLIATLAWPAGAILRRAGVRPTGTLPRPQRLARFAVAAACIVALGWAWLIGTILSTLFFVFEPAYIGAGMEPWIRLLHVLGVVAFPAAALLTLWQARPALADGGGARRALLLAWRWLVAAAAIVLLALACIFDLMESGAAF